MAHSLILVHAALTVFMLERQDSLSPPLSLFLALRKTECCCKCLFPFCRKNTERNHLARKTEDPRAERRERSKSNLEAFSACIITYDSARLSLSLPPSRLAFAQYRLLFARNTLSALWCI